MIGEALKSNSTLTKLDLNSNFFTNEKQMWYHFLNKLVNSIGKEGCKMLCEGLKSNTSLTELNINRELKQCT